MDSLGCIFKKQLMNKCTVDTVKNILGVFISWRGRKYLDQWKVNIVKYQWRILVWRLLGVFIGRDFCTRGKFIL